MTITHDLTNLVNGITTIFLAPTFYIAGTMVVELNGQRLRVGEDFAEKTPPQFELFAAPAGPDTLQIQFESEQEGEVIYPLVVASGIEPGF